MEVAAGMGRKNPLSALIDCLFFFFVCYHWSPQLHKWESLFDIDIVSNSCWLPGHLCKAWLHQLAMEHDPCLEPIPWRKLASSGEQISILVSVEAPPLPQSCGALAVCPHRAFIEVLVSMSCVKPGPLYSAGHWPALCWLNPTGWHARIVASQFVFAGQLSGAAGSDGTGGRTRDSTQGELPFLLEMPRSMGGWVGEKIRVVLQVGALSPSHHQRSRV